MATNRETLEKLGRFLLRNDWTSHCRCTTSKEM